MSAAVSPPLVAHPGGGGGSRRRGPVSNAVAGTLIFVATEAMLFAGFVSAHIVVSSRAMAWPPADQPRLPVEATAFNTLVLLASGVAFVWGYRRFLRDAAAAARPLWAAFGLAAFFVTFQGREWWALLREGLTLTSSPYGSFFYLIIGAHALHALGALTALGWALRRLRRGLLTADQLAGTGVFWGFVVGIWPILYWLVYLR